MAQERIDKLNALEFTLTTDARNDQLDIKWKAWLVNFEAYKAEHGDCNVPVSVGPLGNWVE